jgi:hypothetical protein
MSHATTKPTGLPKVTVGVDLGDRTSALYEVSAEGEFVREATVAMTVSRFTREFGARAACRVVLEVGTHSPWVSRLLAQWGHR